MNRTPDESEDSYEDLYENAPCGFLSMLPDGRIIKANATLSAWTGQPRERILDTHFHQLLTVTSRIHYESHILPLLHMQGHFDEAALDLVTASGGRLAVMANARQRPGADGRPFCVRVALFKATERRLYERELVAAKSASEKSLSSEREAAQLREEFIAVLGHDLRNPLASIAAAARILGREPQSATGMKSLELMQNSVNRMSGLIANVLDFARGRLGDGITVARDRPEDVGPVLQQVVDELRAGFPERAIETDFRLDQPVFCDPSRLGQLASNLLSNALAHGVQTAPVRFHASTGPDRLVLWVANTGAPIIAETAARLFEPFFRGEAHGPQRGLGLGLHIASEIAKAHGGTLSVSSTSEETRFTFSMPLRPAEASA